MVKRFVKSDSLFTFGYRSATRQDRQPLSGIVFDSLSALGCLPARAGRRCVEGCFTRMEQTRNSGSVQIISRYNGFPSLSGCGQIIIIENIWSPVSCA